MCQGEILPGMILQIFMHLSAISLCTFSFNVKFLFVSYFSTFKCLHISNQGCSVWDEIKKETT